MSMSSEIWFKQANNLGDALESTSRMAMLGAWGIFGAFVRHCTHPKPTAQTDSTRRASRALCA